MCRTSPGGNSPAGPARKPPISSATLRRGLAITRGTRRMPADTRGRLGSSSRIRGAFTTWRATCGSGARISTRSTTIRNHRSATLADRTRARTRSCVAARGGSARITADRAIVTMKTRVLRMSASATTFTVFVVCENLRNRGYQVDAEDHRHHRRDLTVSIRSMSHSPDCLFIVNRSSCTIRSGSPLIWAFMVSSTTAPSWLPGN